MGILNKICGILFAIVMVFVGLVIFGEVLGFSSLFEYLSTVLSNRANFWGVLLTSLVLIVVGLALLLLNLRIKGHKSVKVKTEDGSDSTYVNLTTIDGIIRKTSMDIDGVESVKPEIISNGKSIKVLLKVKLKDDLLIPNISVNLQNAVKNTLVNDTCVVVKSVKVLVVKSTIDTEGKVKNNTTNVNNFSDEDK